jgi:secretion/DNA translocation related TadE-like protein
VVVIRSRRRDDRGAATVTALALVSVVLVAALVALAVGQQVLVRQQTATAADVAALGAAQATADPCEVARQLVTANGAQLIGCQSDGVDVVVTAGRAAPPLVRRLFGLLGTTAPGVTATVRAGPPQSPG